MSAVAVDGLFEAHVTVRRLETSITFYRDVVGLELATRIESRRVAFFWIGGRGRTMLGVWECAAAPNRMQVHVAFATTVEAMQHAVEGLRAGGVTPLGIEAEPVDEPVVIGWMPAVSLYFRDPDGNLLEYLAMLPEAPAPDRGVVPWSEWRSRTHSA